jgi:hypothetical protein
MIGRHKGEMPFNLRVCVRKPDNQASEMLAEKHHLHRFVSYLILRPHYRAET